VQRAVQNAAPGEKVRVARWQAGGNCDQSIREDGHTFELTQIPAGALDPGTVNVIGDACVVNPTTVFEEIDLMRSRGVFPELLVSERAHLVFPFHQTIRAAEDAFRYGQKKWGGGIGIGVGPAQADKWGRAGIPIRLFRPENRAILEEKLKEQIMRYNALLEAYGVELRYSYDEVLAQFDAAYARMKQEGWLIPSASQHLETALREGETVIFQGTQAGMVDMDHGGDYPQVTSSNTIAGAVYGATGIAPAWIRSRYGIVKAYGTRNHEGIMVPELKDEVATDEAALSHLREKGREYFYDWAKWEKQGLGGEPPMNFGRPKRAAWLDAVANGYMARKSGITGFIVTKLDVFSGLPEIRICVGYRVGDQVITAGTFDGSAEISRIAEPVYETLPGWTEDISGVTDFALLPSAAQRFLVRVGELLSVPVVRFATGPKAENEGVVPQALFAGLTGFYQTGVAS
jgi:adenylosuccinate synthase